MKTMKEYIVILIRSLPNADGVSTRGGAYHTNGGGSCPWIWTSLKFHEPDPFILVGGESSPAG